MAIKWKSVYMLGIGGISMSAIAYILHSHNVKIMGSDISYNKQIDNLIKENILEFSKGNNKSFVEKCDAVIYSSAISSDNSDLAYAKKLGKPIFSRAEMLGILTKNYKTISIAGSHGKTTCTGIVYQVLSQCYSPMLHIGGVLKNIDSNVNIGSDDLFITEACEFKDNFLSLQNDISVVLNIKPEHLDYFHTLENEFSSYQKFVDNTFDNGTVILNNDDPLCQKLVTKAKRLTFAISNDADLVAKNISQYENGKYMFDAFLNGENLGKVYLSCFGFHNIYNALVAILIGKLKGMSFADIKKGIESFKGIERRFEIIKQTKYCTIIHDYAHHPDEIDANISLCRSLGKKRLVVIFQPHTYTRTHDLYDEFLAVLSKADEVWLLPIYPAREKAIKGVSSFKMKQDLAKLNKNTKYFKNFMQCKQEIIKNYHTNSIFLILGAGDIVELAYIFYDKK